MRDYIESICSLLNLGTLTADIRQVSGGLLHRMYRVQTDQGVYALKLLNPHIMKRSDAMANYRTAEYLEERLEMAGMPVLPAISFQGRKMQELDGWYFYLFPWFEGQALKPGEIKPWHCMKIGEALARIHKLPWQEQAKEYKTDLPGVLSVDWELFLQRLSCETGASTVSDMEIQILCKNLESSLPVIIRMQERGNQALSRIPKELAICHNDLDSKNVLWRGEDFRIIDLECLCPASPFLEYYEQALGWSGLNECSLDFEKYEAFLTSYFDGGGHLPPDWEILYESNIGRLDWLRYSLERVLGINCGEEEREIGLREAEKTLNQICYYDRMREEILERSRELVKRYQ